MIAGAEGTRAILDFWFGEIGPARWWTRSAETDAAIVARFADLWEAGRGRAAANFLGSADEALAAIILFDQFPRNMFRGQARAFSTDALARAIAREALDRGLAEGMSREALSLFYMPFQHSEDAADQERSLALFGALGLEEPLRFAGLHHEMIARFGRFPARNAALGRASRPEEAAAIAASKGW